ncbi:hypothetical protein AB6A23_12245 [Paenibacillus tarimensis]
MGNGKNVQRNIAKVWMAHKNRLSPTHYNSFILEPGRFAEYDPFRRRGDNPYIFRVVGRCEGRYSKLRARYNA